MTSPALYSWACCVHGGTRFVYVYGPLALFWRLTTLHDHTVIQKDPSPSLELCRVRAEAAAAALASLYEGLGTAWAMPLEDFLALVAAEQTPSPFGGRRPPPI